MEFEIQPADLDEPALAEFLEGHRREMFAITPEGSAHALGVEGLRAPEVSVWVVREAGALLGCGAIKELAGGGGELKSMRTAPEHRGKGVARALLTFLIEEGRRRGYPALYLETGSFPAFAPARALYEGFGFAVVDPFEGYVADPNSVFMRLEL